MQPDSHAAFGFEESLADALTATLLARRPIAARVVPEMVQAQMELRDYGLLQDDPSAGAASVDAVVPNTGAGIRLKLRRVRGQALSARHEK